MAAMSGKVFPLISGRPTTSENADGPVVKLKAILLRVSSTPK